MILLLGYLCTKYVQMISKERIKKIKAGRRIENNPRVDIKTEIMLILIPKYTEYQH